MAEKECPGTQTVCTNGCGPRECRYYEGKNSVNKTEGEKNIAASRLSEFDAAIQKVTQARGAVYGHPKVDFGRVHRLKAVVADCKDPLMRHVLEMICVKVARLVETPDHLDSLIDIAGYARCGVMVTDPSSTSVANSTVED